MKAMIMARMAYNNASVMRLDPPSPELVPIGSLCAT
jgi:hypothetical protein